MKKIICVLLLSAMTACSSDVRSLSDIIASGELKILTLNTPTTYYENNEGEIEGLEYEMTSLFAKWLGVRPKYVVVDSVEELFQGLEQQRGDMIAAGISVTPERKKNYLFGPSYQTIKKNVVCTPYTRPKKIKDLLGLDIVVLKGTSYVEALNSHKEKFPGLEWKEVSGVTDFQLFQDLDEEKYDCTISDSNITSIARRPFPQLEVPMSLKGDDKLAWVIHLKNPDFQEKLEVWFNDVFSDSKKNELLEKHFGHTRQFDPYDTKVFYERLVERLPKYKGMFIEAEKTYNWPWELLAAISYQESQWDPKAKSPTGVRGLMMLTQNTAKEVGVKDRLDPKESIMGGARYLSQLRRRIPSHIPPRDQMWMTFASYNIGYQHLRNSRAVAVWKDLNPNSWANVRKVLPLLTQKKYYRYLPNGFARGSEPVIYVDRIRHYYDLISNSGI